MNNPDSSPTTPQLSRLKHCYVDDSPTSPSSSNRPVSRTPSLVAAARDQASSQEDIAIQRLVSQFGSVGREAIVQSVRRNRLDLDRAVHEISRLHARSSDSDSPVPISTAPRPVPRPPAPVPISSSPIPVSRAPPKPKKNESSAIYKNRGNGGKKRDPDESSEGEAVSDGESEMDWSGDDGPSKKKRRANDDEIDAEGAALKAFNEEDAGVLTGTIGALPNNTCTDASACSTEQANKIISLRPYEDADEVRTKLNKARGVSIKLFEQYTEIMEGFVQIDSCLNRCEAIATDVGNTLAVWRGASHAADSTVGTPRSDGLNDVKVDVSKVSELLRNETDARRRKILREYIQSQPPSLSEGTVLKDYQLLGVNWLNLLYSKKIGCILADEMGEFIDVTALKLPGLGKTIQVIAFLASLKERGNKGPHMIFVPSVLALSPRCPIDKL